MGTVLGLIARQGRAGLPEFDAALNDAGVAAFRERVSMVLDEEVDQAYPKRWIGKVTVQTKDGRSLSSRVDEPKGDPGNTLARPELEDKALRLGTYRNAASAEEVKALTHKVWNLAGTDMVGRFLD
jgi:2-methylcitrate dehydratase PrpD